MTLRDAARAACLSRAFLRSWRCYPNLIFDSCMLPPSQCWQSLFFYTVDTILKMHSGIGLKILKLDLLSISYGSIPCYVDTWLQVAVTPGIQKLTLLLDEEYNFPCSLLSHGVKNSIRHLALTACTFRPMPELGPLRSLAYLHLSFVRITEDELEGFLSNSLALEKLYLCGCEEMVSLKIPCVLHRLRHLTVHFCWGLQVENKAPNLSTLDSEGNSVVRGTLQMKELRMNRSECICYARAELPYIMPNLETLDIFSQYEVVNTPMLPTKFVYLKHLSIKIPRESSDLSYDYFSLVSFLDVSPSLQTLSLHIGVYLHKVGMQHESILGASPSLLRELPDHCRCDCLKSLEITGFSSAKSLVELTSCIVKSAVLLERLTLDTLHDAYRCSKEKSGNSSPRLVCYSLSKDMIDEASRAVKAVRMYIEDDVPPAAKLTVRGPCTRCHSIPALI